MPEQLIYKTATELSTLLAKKEINSIELTQAFIDRSQKIDTKIQAYLDKNIDYALSQAKESDNRRAKGEALSPLDGIPVSLKDLIADKGQQLTCASKILHNFVSPYSATVTQKLKSAGAVLWGRTNMDEFAMGSSNENSSVMPCYNPWNTLYSPGGSSGGSAAAVAACMTPLSLGSDTGGSIRQPAALCGIVGIKPTYGLVSRYGLAAFASSLDQIGPFARSVEDAALLLQCIAGPDSNDSTSYRKTPPNYTESLGVHKKWTLGIPKEYFSEGLDEDVRQAVQSAINFYEKQGHTLKSISLPYNTDYAMAVYYTIAPAEASSNLARYDGIRYGYRSPNAKDGIDLYFKTRGEGFGQEVKRRILLGTYVLSSGYYDAYYLKAQKVRTLIRNDYMKAFEEVDAIITPTTPSANLKIGEKTQDPLKMYLNDIYTVSANIAGLPAMSIPCAINKDNFPIGLHIVGKPFGEADMLAIAQYYQSHHSYKNIYPNL